MSDHDDAILRIGDVCQRTGLGRTAIYELTRAGDFPVPVQITARATGWIASEVANWIRARPRVDRFAAQESKEGSRA